MATAHSTRVKKPIARVTVELIDCGAGTCSDGDESVVASTVTNAEGEFEFTGVPDGTYQTSITTTRASLSSLLETTSTAGVNTVSVAGASVLNAPSDAGTPSFGYNAPGSIGDRIWSTPTEMAFKMPNELGLGGVTVQLVDDATERCSRPPPRLADGATSSSTSHPEPIGSR